MFTFRKVEVRDKDRVLEISSCIWDGYDYIPGVFDEWIKDTEGEFTLAETEGSIVGFAKYTKLAADEAWLEGIRADHAFAGKGFGDAMTKYFIGKAVGEGLNKLRLSTFIENYQSIHIIEKNGFKKDGLFSYCFKDLSKNSEALTEKSNVVTIMSTAAAWSYIEKSRSLILSNGYISNGWRFYKLNYELLDNLVKSGKVAGTLKDGSISALAILWREEDASPEASIAYIDGSPQDQEILLHYMEQAALKGGVQSLEVMAVLDPALIRLLTEKNYEFVYDKPEEANVYVYTFDVSK